MAIDLNDEILQDFLVEAGEIIELLDEQLVSMEKSPEDGELLNAIFRGFHTVKGGAGFLSIDPMVILCHCAEDVFNLLRQGDLKVTSELMDVILDVHDKLRGMFDSINDGSEPEYADSLLIKKLESFCKIDVAHVEDDSKSKDPENNEDITDDEFEDLLDKIHGESSSDATSPDVVDSNNIKSISDEDISDDEFEKLLDEMHGVNVPGKIENNSPPVVESSSPAPVAQSSSIDKEPPASPSTTEKSKSKKSESETAKTTTQVESTVRVDTKRLDDIMNLVGELVLVRNRMTMLSSSIVNEDLSVAVNNLDIVTSDLQTSVMKTRMQPIKKVFGRFPRVVRDLSRSLNKDIELVMVGEDTDLDKNLVEALADPLVHLVRNSVDHGIEMPDIREKNGKKRRGTITLSAQQEGENILLCIVDDGAGMDADLLRGIAVKKGVLDEEAAARLTSEECYNLIFMPGFSTKEKISDISGRGVGMDVVKTKIAELNGSIVIKSELGKGSRIEIRVPLTLAIMPTLMVMVSDQVYALPLANVVEIFNYDASMSKVVDGHEVVIIRNKPLQIYHLNKWLSKNESNLIGNRLVVINSAGTSVGFVVERLLGQEEVVIKPLGALLQGTKGMSGATITGDGKISLILDVPGLLNAYACGF